MVGVAEDVVGLVEGKMKEVVEFFGHYTKINLLLIQ